MASSSIPPLASAFAKKQSSRSKKSKTPTTDSSALERRSWEAWGQREESIFFDSLVRNSRNWGAIATDIGTKRSEQVRTYYYRVLRKISRLLQAVHFNFDNRDRINTLIALLAYWEAKCETQFEETTIEFAEAIKDRILRQRQELDTMRSKRHPTPEKLTVQLVPSTEEVSALLAQCGHNPKLQLTLKSKKSMSSIVDHLNGKWVSSSGGALADTPLRLYIPEKFGHPGYGIESTDVTILTVFHSMNCPTICKLEYDWNPNHSRARPGVLPGHEHQELQSTSDEGSDEHSSDSGRSGSPIGTAAHSPRGANQAINRLAVPDTTISGGKGLSEDALDDDALRHGQMARQAKLLLNPKKIVSKPSASFPVTRSQSASPPLPGPAATPRYSTRSRRAASTTNDTMDDTIQETGYGESSSVALPQSGPLPGSLPMPGTVPSTSISLRGSLSASMGMGLNPELSSSTGMLPSDDLSADMYGNEDASGTVTAADMHPLGGDGEYAYPSGYEAAYDVDPLAARNAAPATMVINNHYYQPTWDNSVQYYQTPVDFAYPSAQTPYYMDAYFPPQQEYTPYPSQTLRPTFPQGPAARGGNGPYQYPKN